MKKSSSNRRDPGLVTLANGSGDLDSIPGCVIPKTLKMVLDTSLLNTQQYKVLSRVKWSNPGKGVAASPAPRCSSYWKGSLPVTLDYGRQLYLYCQVFVVVGVIIWFNIPFINNFYGFSKNFNHETENIKKSTTLILVSMEIKKKCRQYGINLFGSEWKLYLVTRGVLKSVRNSDRDRSNIKCLIHTYKHTHTHTDTYTHISTHIYIYVCVCVCV